ncbi:pilus assembly protein TadG-related protein [Nocardioides sp. B-3]|uniref:pilus assembly protein TadG-related protein n=1 Tax=Nocardioides sp. B-3 TaxID=2895565 RepID=UPI003FA54E5B
MRRRNESGAIAIPVALLAIVIVGLSAFVADFGLAYANKRAMQTAADAAAPGAAGVFANVDKRLCADIRSDGFTDAQTEATSKVAANDTGSSVGAMTLFEAECLDGDLVVRTTVTGPSPNFFGGVFGMTDAYEVTRSAAAAVEAGTTGPKLRPMALCLSDIPANAQPGTPFKLFALGTPPAGHLPRVRSLTTSEQATGGHLTAPWSTTATGTARPHWRIRSAMDARPPSRLSPAGAPRRGLI